MFGMTGCHDGGWGCNQCPNFGAGSNSITSSTDGHGDHSILGTRTTHSSHPTAEKKLCLK